MKPNKTYTIDRCAPYPGEYQPLFRDWNEIMTELHKPNDGNSKPSANISEFEDYYKVEIVAPGHSKEDFIVNLDKNKLSVVAIRPKLEIEQKNYHLHEFNFEYFSHLLELPGNIDVDFISAKYNSGILSICFPKTSTSTINVIHNIIIY